MKKRYREAVAQMILDNIKQQVSKRAAVPGSPFTLAAYMLG
ncbi:hypothetical protein [Rheinheimera gaetbuli]